MIKFFDRNISGHLSMRSSLCRLFGVGFSVSTRICCECGVSPFGKLKLFPFFKLREIENFVFSNFLVERPLRMAYRSNVELKLKKGLYSGLRIRQNLPSRGQRTRSNARTAKVYKRPLSL